VTSAQRSAFVVSCVFAAAACASAHLVQPPGSATPTVSNGPVNQSTLPGIVEYGHAGTSGLIAKRRADAFKKMTAACNGRYRIDDEGPQVAGSGKDSSDEWIIHFSCVSADSAAATPHI
jgi:hypothetical protein